MFYEDPIKARFEKQLDGQKLAISNKYCAWILVFLSPPNLVAFKQNISLR